MTTTNDNQQPIPHHYERDSEDTGDCAECGRGIADAIHNVEPAEQPAQPFLGAAHQDELERAHGQTAQPTPANPDNLTTDDIAAIKQGCDDSLAGRVVERDFSAYAQEPPSGSAGDEAAVVHLAGIIADASLPEGPCEPAMIAMHQAIARRVAQRSFAAIRANPALYVPEVADLRAAVERMTEDITARMNTEVRMGEEVADLRARLAEAERQRDAEEKMCSDALEELEDAEGRLTEVIHAFDPDWEWSNLNTPNRALDVVREKGRECELVKADRDRLKSELREAHRDQEVVWNYLKPNESNDMPWCDEIIVAIDNRVLAAVAESEARADDLARRLEAAERERDDADRRAGAAERSVERHVDTERRREDWLRKAKKEWGVDDSLSFDHVWAECLRLKADLAAEREFAVKHDAERSVEIRRLREQADAIAAGAREVTRRDQEYVAYIRGRHARSQRPITGADARDRQSAAGVEVEGQS